MAILWRDGTFLDESEFQISPFDRGLCHGLSLFETLLAVNGEPRLLTEHLNRLKYGLERLNVKSVAIAEDGIRKAMIELLKRNKLENGMARIRFAVSLGIGPLNRIDSGQAWAWMIVSPMEQTGTSIRMTIAPWRKDKESVLRGLKVGNYAEHLIGLDMARCEGFDEMLFYNSADELCEAAMANIFLIRGGNLFTPSLDSGCLAGVTRELILKLADAHKIRCTAKPLRKSDVAKAEGMFLTSSTKGPIWVATLEGKSYETHPLFSAIRKLWLEQMATGG
jgi:branched-subunit amino acid aminotransferase/4-amino-4-deoxychorismate lyase